MRLAGGSIPRMVRGDMVQSHKLHQVVGLLPGEPLNAKLANRVETSPSHCLQGLTFDSSYNYKLAMGFTYFDSVRRGQRSYAFNVMKGNVDYKVTRHFSITVHRSQPADHDLAGRTSQPPTLTSGPR